MSHDVLALSAIPDTLRIPLAARALGNQLFPHMAMHDRYASDALHYMGDDGQRWLQDRASVYGSLARTHYFRQLAQIFLAEHPNSRVVNVGYRLSDYLQWIDNGYLQMSDADLPEVMRIRCTALPPQHDRHTLAEVDLTAPNWWQDLQLPTQTQVHAIFLMAEGVFTHFKPAVIHQILHTFGKCASRFGADFRRHVLADGVALQVASVHQAHGDRTKIVPAQTHGSHTALCALVAVGRMPNNTGPQLGFQAVSAPL